MPQLEHIEAIERRLWSAADTLRANSTYASNEYFLPVMGLVFLRHAFSRYLAVKPEIESNLPTRGGKTRPLSKEDFSQKNAIFLRPEAQFDHLVGLPDGADRASAIIRAMESIEEDYLSLRDTLPKNEYRELSNDVLGQLLRTLNPEELKEVGGDVFGRIYEYFLTQFADQKAHDGGEFFTPVSIVSLIAHVLDPERGTVLDPACGSGGMFVQSARTVEEHGGSPTQRLTFRGLEKNATTIRLAKMNLAVHGLEGDIRKAITYYEDPHELVGRADYVMANPPFNVDEIDAEKIKNDPRLPFGFPGVNKQGKVSNGNYVWISYFHSYLNQRGRAGFVMSSQASSAGRHEKTVRRKLIETGDVDLVIAIRSNFFYTRTVPCELWFLNRDKCEAHKDTVLMLDASREYRQVTRRICDFSPEQHKNLLAIVSLYRGETGRFVDLLSGYLWSVVDEGKACFEYEAGDDHTIRPIPDYQDTLSAFEDLVRPFLDSLSAEGPHTEAVSRFQEANEVFRKEVGPLETDVARAEQDWPGASEGATTLAAMTESYRALAESCVAHAREADTVYRLIGRLVATCERECEAKSHAHWSTRDINRARKATDQARERAIVQLRLVHYYWRQAHWLTSRFPEGQLRDIQGLVKVVDRTEIAAKNWSLTPSRYVGVAPKEEDEDFDFQEALREIHGELQELTAESVELAAKIATSFQVLSV